MYLYIFFYNIWNIGYLRGQSFVVHLVYTVAAMQTQRRDGEESMGRWCSFCPDGLSTRHKERRGVQAMRLAPMKMCPRPSQPFRFFREEFICGFPRLLTTSQSGFVGWPPRLRRSTQSETAWLSISWYLAIGLEDKGFCYGCLNKPAAPGLLLPQICLSPQRSAQQVLKQQRSALRADLWALAGDVYQVLSELPFDSLMYFKECV